MHLVVQFKTLLKKQRMKAPRKQRDLQVQLKGNEGMLLKLVLKESGLGLLTQKHEYETDVNKLSTISNQAMRKKVIERLRSKNFKKYSEQVKYQR